MNLSDLEQRMKEDFDEIEFSPKDREWERMQAALKPKRSALPLLLPFHKAVAAAALLVGVGTTGLYLFLSRPERDAMVLSTGHSKRQPISNTAQKSNKPLTEEQIPIPSFSGLAKQDRQAGPVPVSHEPARPNVPVPIKEKQQTAQQPVLVQTNRDNDIQKTFNRSQQQPGYYYQAPANSNNPLHLGIAANVGKPSLGNVQYNLGVVARKNLSQRFYAEANVSLSSSNVTYSEMGKAGADPADGLGSSVKPAAEFNFISNVISVGVAPSLGFKVTHNLSVAAGGDVYRALNRDLRPQVAPGYASSSYNLSGPPPERNITNWDLGLKAQLEYKLNGNFSLNTQYRQGLTQYIHVDGKSLKNSNFTFGLKYYFLKVQ